MNEIDKARDAAWDAAHGSYDSNRDYFDVGFAAGLATATAKIEQQTAEIKRLTNALRLVYSAGHNLDCIFCGLKDKHVFDALRPKDDE